MVIDGCPQEPHGRVHAEFKSKGTKSTYEQCHHHVRDNGELSLVSRSEIYEDVFGLESDFRMISVNDWWHAQNRFVRIEHHRVNRRVLDYV